MDEKISKLFLPLLDKLYNQEPAGEPFRKPVDVVKYGCFDYYYYVKHPIDLSTIRERLVSNQYKDAWRFVADIQLMLANAYLFNKKGTPVYEYTNKLSKLWNTDLAPIMQRLNYCCGTLHKFGPQLLFCHGTTPDKYCQIPIGAKYKCYEDQYSFCMPCFNKINTDYVSIQGLSCETQRMKLPTQPVKKSDFSDCANDKWQYESFISCSQCSRRVHQICELYPASEDEISKCIQHDELELEQKMLCQVPREYRTEEEVKSEENDKQKVNESQTSTNEISTQANRRLKDQNESSEPLSEISVRNDHHLDVAATSLDDELLEMARDVEDSHLSSAPVSPNPEESRSRFDSAKDNSQPKKLTHVSGNSGDRLLPSSRPNVLANSTASHAKNSVDSIAARLSINKLGVEAQSDEIPRSIGGAVGSRSKFVCNHCYRKKKIGFNLRHRKHSARRLPHTRMSKYIETKVNEHIRENSPTAGEVTIRVLTAYRDTTLVKPEMQAYMRRCKEKDPSQQHKNLNDYPDEYAYTNRAIFAWQEIDGVDVCVFGMHVQEYGEDCPEPNRQVVYLSYLDSVHFFRPKQVRTAVYHEILLSYFKYVKKLGFRRVFIWVCPSRKGDDYIFYRHPTEQKMPTLKRLSDWYVSLLDKGIIAGIVERHQNIYQYAVSENWASILSIPYLNGDFWPGEFERLLKSMIESQKQYEIKLEQDRRENISMNNMDIVDNYCSIEQLNQRNSIVGVCSAYQKQPPKLTVDETRYDLNLVTTTSCASNTDNLPNACLTPDRDINNLSASDETFYTNFTEDSSRSECDKPLDLSKSSSNTSPESYFDDDRISEASFKVTNNRKRRRKSSVAGYTKKRGRGSTQVLNSKQIQISNEGPSTRYCSQPPKSSCRRSTQWMKDPVASDGYLTPEQELMKNLERSLKRQKEGFIVARLNECDCSPHFESQRRKEEATFTCELMKGREPFLQLARLKNYEFSTLRRAKFSSLAMVKHLGEFFKLDPICDECFSFDSSKRHYACSHCPDFYLCTSCHENTQHEHIMSLMAPSTSPDIEEFLPQCSLTSAANSISSASSTISNKSFNESTVELSLQPVTPISRKNETSTSTPLNRHLSNARGASTMPLSCHRQKNREFDPDSRVRTEDEENANICSFDSGAKLNLPNPSSPPPSHSSSNIRSNLHIELDQVLVENFIRHAEVSYDVDFEQMNNESKKLLTHYWSCPMKETCHKCKFVVLSCSFMSVFMRSSRMQMMINCNPSEMLPTNNSNLIHPSGINLTPAHRFNYQPKDK